MQVRLSAADLDFTHQEQFEAGILTLGVKAPGIVLISGLIESVVYRHDDNSIFSEFQDVEVVAGLGYAVLHTHEEGRMLDQTSPHGLDGPYQPLVALLQPPLSRGRKTSAHTSLFSAEPCTEMCYGLNCDELIPSPVSDCATLASFCTNCAAPNCVCGPLLPPSPPPPAYSCDPCEKMVAGDVNGDCRFLSSDVDALNAFVTEHRSLWQRDQTGIDPVFSNPAAWTVDGSTCSFLQQQLNPMFDVLPDRFSGAPVVDAVGADLLQRATVKKTRLLANRSLSCAYEANCTAPKVLLPNHSSYS